jgi:hypothetical protein
MIVVTGSVTAREDSFAAGPMTLELFDASKIEKL